MEETQATHVRQLLQGLARRLLSMQKDCIRRYDVTFGHSHVVYAVQNHPGISLGELADSLGLDDSTASRHVKSLMARGLIEAASAPTDRRQLALRLTDSGRELHGRIAAGMAGYIQDLFAQVPAGKRHQVVESLEIVLAAMDRVPACCSGSDNGKGSSAWMTE
ncbi:MAG: MarR family transcriptional regulator [Peptococcaceae bacterium]|jgi:DNA-binding MarR family transcriptional regulator|nr:MarR family transcriptional regulator [Peptococcaceae bacterium]